MLILALHQLMPNPTPVSIMLAALITLSGCHPAAPITSPRKAKSEAQPHVSAITPNPPLLVSDSHPAEAPRLLRKEIAGIEFEGVSFDSRTHKLLVADQPDGPGSEFPTAADAARIRGALLAINAGFFTPEGKPLGILISNGKTAGAWNSASSLGNGIFSETSGGYTSISRRGSRSVMSDAKELLQAGPLLLENGNEINGLDGSKSALRSILLTDGDHRWWIGKTSSCTLAALGSALSSGSPAAWEIQNALNLDGGRSTDLFISSSILGGPITRRGFLNRPVRNFLILMSR